VILVILDIPLPRIWCPWKAEGARGGAKCFTL
jgi:hypothetical protein